MKVSIIIPVCNEARSLSGLFDRLQNVLVPLGHEYEIIFIDDGSTDDSMRILEEIYEKDSKVCVLSFRRNFGKSAALSAGFDEGRGEIFITLDSDLQDQPEEIPRLIEKIQEGYDVVVGWKQKRRDPFFNVIASKIFNSIISFSFGLPLHDINCGLKAYRASVITEVELYGELHRFLPLFIYKRGFRVTEISVLHKARKHGKSKYGILKFFHGFIDLFTVLLLTKYIQRPAHFFGSLGVINLIIGLAICFYLTILWFLGQRPIGTRPLLLLGILCIIVSFQLISMGLFGEVLVNKRPKTPYYIKKRLSRDTR